jgi:hypothetical protein
MHSEASDRAMLDAQCGAIRVGVAGGLQSLRQIDSSS